MTVALSLWAAACDAGSVGSTDAGARDDAGRIGDAGATDARGAPDAGVVDGEDDAAIAEVSLPSLLGCGEATTASLTLTNSGTSTWTVGDVALEALGDADPFTATTRIELGADVAPSADARFDIALAAPMDAGAHVTDWQMVRGATPFGAIVSRTIAVNCRGIDAIDLASAVVHASPPGVASWPITADMTALDIAPTGGVGSGGIVPDFTKKDGADRWPDVTFLGGTDTIYYTLWLAVSIGGTWHVAGAQQYWFDDTLRLCGIPSGWTTNLFYDAGRWGEMSGYAITPGELIGVFVAAGDHRSRTDTDGSILLERSNVVLIPFPGDTEVTHTF